jgi:hypothetical protein
MSILSNSIFASVIFILVSVLTIILLGKNKEFFTQSQSSAKFKAIKYLPLASVAILISLLFVINLHYKKKDTRLVENYKNVKAKTDSLTNTPVLVVPDTSFKLIKAKTIEQASLHKIDTITKIYKSEITSNKSKILRLNQSQSEIGNLINGTKNQQLFTGNSALNLDSLNNLYSEYNSTIKQLKAANLQYSSYTQLLDSAKHYIKKNEDVMADKRK